MVTSIEVDGEEWRVSGDPTMRTVKFVQKMEIELMREFINDEDLIRLEQAESEGDVMESVMDDMTVDDLENMMWKRSMQEPIRTMCLGLNEQLTEDDVLDLPASKFRQIHEAAKNELGGNAADFIESLGIDISFQEKMDQVALDESNDTLDSMPPIESPASSEQ